MQRKDGVERDPIYLFAMFLFKFIITKKLIYKYKYLQNILPEVVISLD